MRSSPGAGALALLLALGFTAPRARAATATFADPAFDKWLYGNVPGSFGGTSEYAPTFGNLGNDEDDRMGSMLVAFQTSSNILTGQGLQNYEITSVRLTLAIITGSNNLFIYDNSHDPLSSYQAGGVDSDAGRPIEVFGVGLRAPYTGLSPTLGGPSNLYNQNSPYYNGQVQANAFPLAVNSSGQLFDAIDNVSDGIEATPFGVGIAASLDPGDLVPEETFFTFTLDVSSPAVLAYLQQALNTGILGLHVSSLHSGSQPGGGDEQTYPRFYTEDGPNALGGIYLQFRPKLEVEYRIVPEPHISGLLIAGIALFAAGRGLRHRHRMS